ncbi:ACT domain-containing protein [Aliiglaciecola sp. SL4]|uniref:ACT domain-containing protein n=1 Tax=Aliiglaciecola sp. SL4 TaxID=3239806 RepID=UPI00355AF6DD
MANQTLAALPDTFTIYSLPVNAQIPSQVLNAPLYFIGKTHDELSIVVPQTVKLESDESDHNWRVLEILGPLDLSMVGIMAQIGSVLAAAKISIFVVSTFETDYFLIKQNNLKSAAIALENERYKVIL